jgi:hypothetical protein
VDSVRVGAVRTGARRARGPVATDREASEAGADPAVAGAKGAAGVKAVAVIATRARWVRVSASSPT